MSGYPLSVASTKQNKAHGLFRCDKIAMGLHLLLLCAASVLSFMSAAMADNYELERISHGKWIGVADANSPNGPLEECNLGAVTKDGIELSLYSYPNHSWMLILDDKRLKLPAGILVTANYSIDDNATLTRPVNAITQTAVALRFSEQSATFLQLSHGKHFHLSQSASDIAVPAVDFPGLIAELRACRDRWNAAKGSTTASKSDGRTAPAGGETAQAAGEEITTLIKTLGIPNASDLSREEAHQSGLNFDAGFIAPEVIVGINILPQVSADQVSGMLDHMGERAAIACGNQAEIHRSPIEAPANHALVGDIVTSCNLQGIKLTQTAIVLSLSIGGVEVIQVQDAPGDRERPAESPAERLHQDIINLLDGHVATP